MKIHIWTFALYLFSTFTVYGQKDLLVGDKAPEFKAIADNGSTWNIKEFLGKKYIVVYFYPAAMTGGCTKQACSYRFHREDLLSAGVEVIGISGDKIENLRLFKTVPRRNGSKAQQRPATDYRRPAVLSGCSGPDLRFASTRLHDLQLTCNHY